ncbi:hypothetical protein AB0D12_20080 [Streptomyces sp. NPDC048479]|uniref:WXG100 family type VII secretion target n=1 Tax=Streptomyces sp. NPDC048479 TaxID=3154725 RepID=UPI00342BFCCE
MGDEGKVLNIKSADIKAAAPTFHEQSTALVKALTTLKTSLSEAGAAWGDDDAGTQFQGIYAPNVTAVERSAMILAEGLVSIHLAMTDMADGHIDNEELIRAMFSKAVPKPHEKHGDLGNHDRGHEQ